ncbi:hypothetical protein AGMMS50293_13570 [Spirochaetia bacterium]|nr:hypothetical protein AGMMS50293_13570 [Spirochaetia bacterium]
MAEDLMDKVFSFFSGDDLTDDKKMLLKQTLKELNQNKYAKFFRLKTEEVDPSLAAFFFTVYKMTYPVRAFVQDEKKIGRLRQIIIEAFMDSSILETVKRLDSAALEARAKTTAPQEFAAQIQTDLNKLSSQFDSGRISGADRCYNLVEAIAQLANYDFPAFFKKFDENFTEGTFSGDPKFPAIKSSLIVRELGEFLAVIQPLKPEDDWNNLLNLLKICSGQELVQPDLFTLMIKNIKDVQNSKMLEFMIQYTLKNPVWQYRPKIPSGHIGESWLEKVTGEAQGFIESINNAQKNSQISALTKQIFAGADLFRLDNYVPAKGEIYRKRNLEYFAYAEGLNYLKAFLDDYLDKEIKELCDILLIRGQWTNNTMSREMSEALHQLLDMPALITSLDETMSEDGSDGSRLKASMLRVDRDKTQARYINSIIGNNNDEALEMIGKAAQEFIVIGKHMKSLIEDVQKKHPELLINWRELNMASKEPLAQRMIEDYKKINYFVQLMRLCTV